MDGHRMGIVVRHSFIVAGASAPDDLDTPLEEAA
jgi:hypothetical protein